MVSADEAERAVVGRRVEYRRDGIIEWYVNDERGLEQGFTVEERPVGEGALQLVISVGGGLSPSIHTSGRDARLSDHEGNVVLHYSGLRAWDAIGVELTASLSKSGEQLVIEVADDAAVYPICVDPWIASETAKINASNPDFDDGFGSSVSVYKNTAIVGAPRDENVGGLAAGSAYVFEYSAGNWKEVARLAASDGAADDFFGTAVAIAGDTVLVGASRDDIGLRIDAGSVYVFHRDEGGIGAWGEVKRILASDVDSDDRFGSSVALDEETAVVGAPTNLAGEGFGYVFMRNQGGQSAWGEVVRLEASDGEGSDLFGAAVAIGKDRLVVGAPFDDLAAGLPGSSFGEGSAYLFERNIGGASTWGELKKLTASDGAGNDRFGTSVGIFGDIALVGAGQHNPGAPFAGAAYVFERDAGGVGQWGEVKKLTATDAAAVDRFGSSVAVSGHTAVLGAPGDDHSGMNDVGSAYLFHRDEGGVGAWGEALKFTPSDGADADSFGEVALFGGRAVIGAAQGDKQGQNVGFVEAITFDSTTRVLYGVDISNDQLITIDVSTGAGTPVGPIGVAGGVRGLAFDPSTGTIYGADIGADQLITIDSSTGTATAVGSIGFFNVQALAFDPTTGTLYGADMISDQLITIDTATGVGTSVGPLGFDRVQGLAFDSPTSVLYGVDRDTDQLLAIDSATGVASVIGPLGFEGVSGLAFNAVTSTLDGADRSAGLLVTIETSTGAATSVGKFSEFVMNSGAAYMFEISAPSTVYCTAGISASGCQASLATSGIASAAIGSGFNVMATSVEGDKDGLFFLAANGRQANPWGNGTSYQCIVPPVSRASLLTGTGTTGSCDGAFGQDLNALWCSSCPKPAKNPGAGAIVQAQLWYRDPFNTSNKTTSLSDAIEFCVGP
jgi:hypothetical protein